MKLIKFNLLGLNNKLPKLKVQLYHELLKLKNHTDAEINIMYELSKDKDIQKLLGK